MEAKFVPLSAEHIPAILEIEKQTNPAPWSEASFRAELTNRNSIFLTAFHDGRLVGFGGAWVVIDEAHITTVAVEPNYRRQGIGLALMKELLQRSKKQGCTCSTLEVRSQNEAAIKLYEGMGYVSCAVRKHYYPNNDDATVMWLYGL